MSGSNPGRVGIGFFGTFSSGVEQDGPQGVSLSAGCWRSGGLAGHLLERGESLLDHVEDDLAGGLHGGHEAHALARGLRHQVLSPVVVGALNVATLSISC